MVVVNRLSVARMWIVLRSSSIAFCASGESGFPEVDVMLARNGKLLSQRRMQLEILEDRRMLSIVHQWSFDGNGTDAQGGATAELMGGASYSNEKLQLSGAGHAVLPVGDTISGLSDATFEIWLTIATVQPVGARIFSFANSEEQEMYLTIGDTTLGGALAAFVIETPDNTETVAAATPFPRDVATHLAVTIDSNGDADPPSGIFGLYVNGLPVSTTPMMKLTPSDVSPVTSNWLANSFDGAGFDGSIDEFRVHDRALSSSEVLYNFEHHPTIDSPPLPDLVVSDVQTSWSESEATLSYWVDNVGSGAIPGSSTWCEQVWVGVDHEVWNGTDYHHVTSTLQTMAPGRVDGNDPFGKRGPYTFTLPETPEATELNWIILLDWPPATAPTINPNDCGSIALSNDSVVSLRRALRICAKGEMGRPRWAASKIDAEDGYSAWCSESACICW